MRVALGRLLRFLMTYGDCDDVGRTIGRPALAIARHTTPNHVTHMAYTWMRNHMPVSLGAQPDQHREAVTLASTGPCATLRATAKADGHRAIVYVFAHYQGAAAYGAHAAVCWRDRHVEILPLGATMGKEHVEHRMAHPWILDCEVLPAKDTAPAQFLVFDCLGTPNVPHAHMNTWGLDARWHALTGDWNRLAPDPDGLVQFKLKPWVSVHQDSLDADLQAAQHTVDENTQVDGLVFAFAGQHRVYLKWKPTGCVSVDKVVRRVEPNGTLVLDNDERALRGQVCDSTVRPGDVVEFAIGTTPNAPLVALRARPDKTRGNAPRTERDVRVAAELGLHTVDDLARWMRIERSGRARDPNAYI